MKIFSWKAKKKTVFDLNQKKLPIFAGHELIELLGLGNKIKSIERITSVGTEYFNELYRPAIELFIESVQLAPASTAHHHSGPGGLATHTIDVIERALRQRKSFELPLNADSEIIFQQEHFWTYSIFIGALLHDIGKMITSTLIVLDNGKIWNPHQSSLLNSGANSYQIRFDYNPYKYHTQLANSFFHIIPEKGRGWLAQYPDIFSELCAWLYGDYYEFGMIGKIIRFADGQSVAANLKIGGEQTRFINAPEIPLIEKMMTALRELLQTGALKINGVEGSSGWCMGSFTYLVCGTVADKVRSYLLKLGSTDIPGDNTRLFDIWQEHGYAISNQSDAAIWLIKINDRFKLTVLKFETNRLFHPSKQPGEFLGQISVIENNQVIDQNDDQVKKLVAETNIQHQATESTIQSDLTQGTETHVQGDYKTEPDNEQNTVSTQSETGSPGSAANLTTNNQKNEPVKDFYMDGVQATGDLKQSNEGNKRGSTPDYQKPSKLPEDLKLEDPDIAKHFITWIKEGLQERKIQVNNSKALVHVVKEGVLIVTPIAFKKFIWDNKLNTSGGNINKQMTRIQDRLKTTMEKKKLHRRTKSGLNIHTYQINGDSKSAKIKCWLLPVKTIFENSKPPSINPVLENASGFNSDTEIVK
ncbi:MAG: DNA-binding domain-containing protein [Gammaproteobacteria bacterium]|nr:DNA-binding domain-containing protein [Gammaproteobacteria bacterium]